MQRKGYLLRDVQRLINQDRNHFAACMVALDDADAMVTGVTRNFSVALEDVRRVIDPKPGHRVIGLSLVLSRGDPMIFLQRPISAFLLLCAVGVLLMIVLPNVRKSREAAFQEGG